MPTFPQSPLRSLLAASLILSVAALPSSPSSSPHHPKVTLPAHSGAHPVVFQGRSIPEFRQDVFLGIKYADEPVRFTPSEVKREYGARLHLPTYQELFLKERNESKANQQHRV